MLSDNYATELWCIVIIMLPNMNKICENGLSNFSVNFRVMALKFAELIRFSLPNPFIFFNISCAIPHKFTSPCATVFIEFNLRILSFANTYILVYAPARWISTQYCRTCLSVFLRNGLGNILFDHAGREGLRSGLWDTVFWCGTEGLPYNLKDTVFDDAGLGVYRTI